MLTDVVYRPTQFFTSVNIAQFYFLLHNIQMSKPNFRLEEALTSAAAKGYKLALERGISGVTPRDALEVSLQLRRTGPFGSSNLLELLSADEDGRKKIKQLGKTVLEKVVSTQVVDRLE